jgi:hypothetical protein
MLSHGSDDALRGLVRLGRNLGLVVHATDNPDTKPVHGFRPRQLRLLIEAGHPVRINGGMRPIVTATTIAVTI